MESEIVNIDGNLKYFLENRHLEDFLLLDRPVLLVKSERCYLMLGTVSKN